MCFFPLSQNKWQIPRSSSYVLIFFYTQPGVIYNHCLEFFSHSLLNPFPLGLLSLNYSCQGQQWSPQCQFQWFIFVSNFTNQQHLVQTITPSSVTLSLHLASRILYSLGFPPTSLLAPFHSPLLVPPCFLKLLIWDVPGITRNNLVTHFSVYTHSFGDFF